MKPATTKKKTTTGSRNGRFWQEEARRYAQNADHWKARAEAREKEIEELKDDVESRGKSIARCEKVIEAYKEALKFYANSDNYSRIILGGTAIHKDWGRKARKALKEAKSERQERKL